MTIAREVKAGTFKPRVVELGEASHVVTLVLNPTLEPKVPAATRTKIDSLQTKMLTGAYTVATHGDSTPAKR
jgi:basic membrane lipoprotein Med (substrate-binding protein (PBP1-ABC) superfamily)